MSKEPKTKVITLGDKQVTVTYRDLFGREPLDIQEKASSIDFTGLVSPRQVVG